MSGCDTPSLLIAPDFLADPALVRVLAALPGARVVGGAVRDALAGRPVADFDVATPLPPEAVVRALGAAGMISVPTGLAHGTVTAIVDRRPVEVTTLRRDIATDGRHAVVAFTDDWRADAARRDFTINAMSLAPDGAVFDYFGGIADLREGRVRFVGDPATRIAEDYLRVLRFFRFFARYGRGAPDPAALAALAAGVPGLARLSVERVWSELKRILAVDDPDEAVGLMAETGVLRAVLPEARTPLPLWEGMGEGWQRHLLASPTPPPSPPARGGGKGRLSALPADPLLRLAALDPGDVAERLKLSGAERERLADLRGPAPAEDTDDDTLRRMLADTPKEALIGRAWLAGRSPGLRARIAAMQPPVFPLHGRDLQAAGMPPGPAMGAMLRELRAWWLAGGCLVGAAELRAELARRRDG